MNRVVELQEIFEQHGAALVLYARQWCNFPEDALQEAMLELSRQTQQPDDPVAWLFRAVRFRAINISRSESRRSFHQEQASMQNESWFANDPACELEIQDVRSAIERLKPIDREIVVAKIWGGLSFEQIAELVDCSTSSVHRHYGAALSELQKRLEGKFIPSNCHEI